MRDEENRASFIRRAWDLVKRLYRAARDERASPREIAWAVGIGVFIGCTPALGFHGWLALAAATILRKNRLFCWLGCRVCNVVTLPFIVFAEIEVARLLRTGHFVEIDRSTILAQAPALLGDWMIGLVPVGGALAIAMAMLAFGIATLRARRNLALSNDLSHNHPHEPSER